jgi:hypothetical protein
MTPVWIQRVGVCAPGLAHWPAAQAVLAGAAAFAPDAVPKLDAAALPATERRRANATTRWALQAAAEAVSGLAPDAVAGLATVFASADGDGEVLATVLRDLAAEKVALSPTTFHNSVYNAPAGYWSIAAHAPAPSTTVCAGAATFAAGFLEACVQGACDASDVLLVAYDHPFPPGAAIATGVRSAFACALLIAARPDGAIVRVDASDVTEGPATPLPGHLAAAFACNAAASALPLLFALARGEATSVALPYLDGARLTVSVTPCA